MLETLEIKDPNTYTATATRDSVLYTAQAALVYNRNLHSDIKDKKWALEVNFSLSFPNSSPVQPTQNNKVIIQSYQDSSTYENILLMEQKKV